MTQDPDVPVVLNLEDERTRRGLSRKAFAAELGIHEHTLAVFTGRLDRTVRAKTAKHVADFFTDCECDAPNPVEGVCTSCGERSLVATDLIHNDGRTKIAVEGPEVAA